MRHPALSTTERGYGHRHQAERARLVALYRPGQPCAICHQPMRCHPRLLDLAHAAGQNGYLGLAHRGCNRGESMRRTNRRRTLMRRSKANAPAAPYTTSSSRNW